MSEFVLHIDLTTEKCRKEPYEFKKGIPYGRGLAAKLIEEHTGLETDRYDPENVIVLTPGLLVGCKTPSGNRMFIGTVEGKGKGLQMCNTTGNMPQKLGSLGLAGIVITGKAASPDTVIHLDETGIAFNKCPELAKSHAGEIVHALRNKYSHGSAVLGICETGVRRMSLASFFCTYPEGSPEYHSPRSGFGDVFGAKNLKALVVDAKGSFLRDCVHPDTYWEYSKQLTRVITQDEICGDALPGYGSITLLKILKSGRTLDGMEPRKEQKHGVQKAMTPIEKKRQKINYTCAPMCAIGCLNRHSDYEGRQYSSPAESEVNAALVNCFGLSDYDLATAIQKKATDICIVGTEFVTSAKVFAEANGIEHGENHLLEWLDEIEKGTLVGRVIASRTFGVASLYGEKDLRRWLDKEAIDEEHLFQIQMNNAYPALANLSGLELLYAQIFVLENLGLCIFTSFALLDNPKSFELLARMTEERTGVKVTPEELILDARECIKNERELKERRWKAAQKTDIPPFTKVLYRYFDRQKEN